MDKILLASFIFPERLDWFLDYLKNRFNIEKDEVFIFKNLDDESKLMITFRFQINKSNKTNFKDLFPSGTPIHKRGNAIYSINALNKLIESTIDGDIGNIDHKSIKVNWDDYQGKSILINNNELIISNIERIFI